MINHYDDENLKKIGTLKAVFQGYHARREQGTINEQNYDDAIEKFVHEYGCDYDFFSDFGVDLLNADHCDLREVIEKFLESGCKTWDEYCIFLLETVIGMIREKEKEL